MRWFWFATFTLICTLLSVFFRQPLILIGEIFLIDLFITRKVKWLFWMPHSAWRLPAWVNLLAWLFITIWVIRALAIDSITILNPSGRPGLQAGDNILVSKIHYGPRLPMSPFGLPYHRLSGITRINRGNLIAYNFPEGDSTIDGIGSVSYYSLQRKRESTGDSLPKPPVRYHAVDRRVPEVSRCIGLPGDTIAIQHDSLNSLLSYDYLVEVRNRQLPEDLLDRLGLGPTEIQVLPGLGYLIPLRKSQLPLVRERPEVTSATLYLQDPGRGDYNIFPHDARYQWNRDNFGPVIVPRKGDSIRLTLLNLCIFRRIIEVYEKNRVEIRKDEIFINGSPAITYCFRQNYYFVLGDNRHHSRDCRHWGFLPEDHIIGKPVLIWFSASRTAGEPIRIYWNRIFKTL